MELVHDASGVCREFGFVTFSDRAVAEQVLAEHSSATAGGLAGAVFPVRDVHLVLSPAWGQGGKEGSRHSLRTRRRNASYFHRDHVEALSAALALDPRVGGLADASACRRLDQGLRQAVVEGVPPSFASGAARAQYTLERLPYRVGHVFDTLLSQHLAVRHLRAELFAAGREKVSLASVGGGPGFDAVALEFVAAYLGSSSRCIDQSIIHRSTVELECRHWQPRLPRSVRLPRGAHRHRGERVGKERRA